MSNDVSLNSMLESDLVLRFEKKNHVYTSRPTYRYKRRHANIKGKTMCSQRALRSKS